MKPEIKAMLPPGPPMEFVNGDYRIREGDHKAWLEKLTEGATIRYGVTNPSYGLSKKPDEGDTHEFLVLCPREIDNRVPLSEVIKNLRGWRKLDDVAELEYRTMLADRLEKFGVAP